ncbi:MAG: hypothetical protein KJ818_05590 [Candidatus Omnitrophica bacterium]|nr:hypothetical protein [Candidatus Omnitrophota bacterium]
MRALLFKNLSSQDKKRRRISTLETVDQEGIRTVVHRHFVYFVREVNKRQEESAAPNIYIIKQRNTKEKSEKFYCKLKGSAYAVNNDKIFQILFIHSLKIDLSVAPTT